MHAVTVVQRQCTGAGVYSSATIAVTHVCVSHQEPMVTKKNAHAMPTGKPREEHPNAPKLKWSSVFLCAIGPSLHCYIWWTQLLIIMFQ